MVDTTMVCDIQEIPNDNDFIITVRMSVYRYPINVWCSTEDTVYSLKEYMGGRLERYSDEMTVVLSHTCPYPFPDSMLLRKLLDEHRSVLILVHEGKEEPYGRVEQGQGQGQEQDIWWSQEVPQRYLMEKETQEWQKEECHWLTVSKRILDFRFLPKESIPRIRSWLYATRDVSEIWLLGTHPHVMDMVTMIAEDVLSLINLVRIHIQHPMDETFQEPPKSRDRLEHMKVKKSHIERQGIVYLYQHLLQDTYRDSAELIEIWIDGGLLVCNGAYRFVL